ncbi:transposase [Methylobacterium sp. E-065]|uniref:transposase n=1 Tax=Methylobacterium sp. E-065 TaxID=2836583 RepID=UPI00391D05A0
MVDQEGLFWLSDAQWAVIAPYMPNSVAEHLDDRHTVSGIIHVSLTGCRWPDCPAVYGPRGSVYRRFSRWRHRPFWSAMLKKLSDAGWTDEACALDPVAMARSRPRRRGLRIDRKWRPPPERPSDDRHTTD